MSYSTVPELLTGIGDAIREKTKITTKYKYLILANNSSSAKYDMTCTIYGTP